MSLDCINFLIRASSVHSMYHQYISVGLLDNTSKIVLEQLWQELRLENGQS